MASGAKKKKAEEKAMDTKTVAAIDEVKKVSPLQAAIDAKAQKFFDWDSGKGEYAGHAKDVTEAPGMENYLDIYGNAEAIGAQNRIGNPANAFSEGAHPGYSKQLEAQNAMERHNTRAAGLNQGLQGLRSEALGLGASGADADFNRRQAYADAMGGYNTSYYNRPQKKSTWEKIAGLAIGGLGAAGGVAGLMAI